MEFVDTHCHIQFEDYKLDPEDVLRRARKKGVSRFMCVGCTPADSQAAIDFAGRYDDVFASIGIHPHEAKRYIENKKLLQQFRSLINSPKVVAVGETGLDYYYLNSPKKQQKQLLKFQIELALEHNLPLIFHVREAFDDFWKILDNYTAVQGVVHSFSATTKELDEILDHGLYVGLNGIMTFTKNDDQLRAAKQVPLERLVLETDAPFLTPNPFRGKICEPGHVSVTAEFLANLRGESLSALAAATTHNARELFRI